LGTPCDRLASEANLARPPLPAEARADLLEGYRDDIGRLEELIDRDLSHWRE
jgi:hypothetical protein